MNQLCKVCGEPAAGFHFGAFTCEGCKSFFGRTYNNVSSISECKNDGKCVINKKNRTACKACRLRKCMMVGMSKSGSRYGRRSNWFKIHCLLQQQQQQQSQQQAPPFMPHHHHHHPHDVTSVNLVAAASLLRPNPYLGPLFHTPQAQQASIQGMRETPSNCGSDSGQSSEDDTRSTLSYLKPGGGSPLSDRVSIGDAIDFFSSSSSSKNHGKPLNNNHLKALPTSGSPQIGAGADPTPPTGQRWFPPPFPVVWRELWLRGQSNCAETASDQEQPIDLSVKQGEKTEVKASEKEMQDEKVGVPLDLTLAER
ncbi:hypothetical protein ABEB36_001780 [Hypothenemus hampei]